MERLGEGWHPPAAVRQLVEFHWMHVPPGGSLVLVILSVRPLWFVGHYVRGRMLRCREHDCEYCAEGIGRQIRYVFSVADVSTRRVGVIEVSESVARQIRQWAFAQEGARGLIVEITKRGKSKHSRMEVSKIDEHCPAWAMALAPLDLVEVMSRTWERVESQEGRKLLEYEAVR